MKNLLFYFLSILTIISLSSCEVMIDIFEAGFYSGIFLVAMAVGLVIFITVRLSRKK